MQVMLFWLKTIYKQNDMQTLVFRKASLDLIIDYVL